jgi:flagellar basal-body rod modification protein FlgD
MPGITPTQSNLPYSTQTSGFSGHNLGKNEFLQLLITKLTHQDPLEPNSDEQFIADLAQFSALEQMTNIAAAINAGNEWNYMQSSSMHNLMAANLIGKEVSASYESVYLDTGESATIRFATNRFAEQIEFKIKNSDGNVVATVRESHVQIGTHSLQWDGNDSRGNRLPNGTYTVEAIAYNGDSQFRPELSLSGLVESVVYRNGSPFLIIDGVEIKFGDVRSVGVPTTATDDPPDEG